MTLDAHIVRQLGPFDLDVELDARAGEVVAFLGPNGAGKSTVFRCLAGLLPLDDGRIDLDGECLDDPQERIFVPPERRPVAVVFQSFQLMANLTALENVAFGLRARGMGKHDARAKARMQGYEGDPCGECGNFTLVRNGTCMKCDTCGGTSGCS